MSWWSCSSMDPSDIESRFSNKDSMQYMESLFEGISEEKIMQYRQLKNKYLLVAGEIQYGVESVEYKHLQEIVSRNEKKSERLNDFR